jgi:transposase
LELKRPPGCDESASGEGSLTPGITPIKKLTRTVRQYWNGIVSYFDCRITQGTIEALNGIIQLARCRATGVG